MEEFLRAYPAAVFALIGALTGSLLSLLGTWMLKRSDLRLRLREKILDRRIEAHERITQLSKAMRIMVVLDYDPDSGELLRSPALFRDRETFENWYFDFTTTASESSTWLTSEVTRELNFAQDYLVNLHEFLKKVDTSRYLSVGAVVRQDFIDLSTSIERLAFDYFTKGLTTLKLNDLRRHHKYASCKTLDRLEKMHFRSRFTELANLASDAT